MIQMFHVLSMYYVRNRINAYYMSYHVRSKITRVLIEDANGKLVCRSESLDHEMYVGWFFFQNQNSSLYIRNADFKISSSGI